MKGAATREDSRREIILGCATLVLATAYYLQATRIPQSDISDVIGAQGLPRTYAALLALLSVILIGRASMARRAAAAQEDPAIVATHRMSGGVVWRTLGMLLIGILYVALVSWLGYLLSIAGLIAATIYFQGGKLNRVTWAVAFGGALVLWLLFVRILHIPHPAGIWPSIF